jgi:spermidine/putrescine transport system permease protein
LLHSLRLATLTAIVATPLGVATAIGLHRWHSRSSRVALWAFVVAIGVPQTVLASAFFLAIVNLTAFRLGVGPQLLGHITLALPFVVLIVWISLSQLPAEDTELAMDLGAPEHSALFRVTLPQIVPAIVTAATVAWLLSFDNLVLSSWTCIFADCITVPMRIYGRGAPRAQPILFAYGTIMLVITLLLGLVTVPWLRRILGQEAHSAGGGLAH